jgi:hypothetical protein
MNEKVAFFRLDHGAAPSAAKARAAKTPGAKMQGAAPSAPASVTRLPAAAPARREPVPAKVTAAAVNGRRGGPVGRMQAAVATAVAEDKDWQEF